MLTTVHSGLGIDPFLVIFLSAKDFALVARIVIPIDAMENIVKLVEVAPNVSTMRPIDLLVDIRVGVAWQVTWVDDVVASHPLKIGTTSLETTSTWSMGVSPP